MSHRGLTGSLLSALALLSAWADPAAARMRIDGTGGPLILYGTETRILRNVAISPSPGFEMETLSRFEADAGEVGYFGAMVIDRTATESAFYYVGLHSVEDALSLATAMCATKAADPLDCVEAARAVPAGLDLAETGAATVSRAAVSLFLDLMGTADPGKGTTGVSLSGIGHIAISGPQPDRDSAAAASMTICQSFLDATLQSLPVEERRVLASVNLDACRVVFIQ